MKPVVLACMFLSVCFLAIMVLGEPPTSSLPTLLPFIEKHELAGVVALVANKDKVLLVDSVGFADVATAEAMKNDSMFWIASQTKPMTAVAVMMLVDQGKISLDDAIEKYLPEFTTQMVSTQQNDGDETKLHQPTHPITLREVLSHMSGLPFSSAQEKPTLDGLPLNIAVESYAKTPLQTEPGTHYRYSNAGINTAARIIEVVAGVKYEEFMQQKLFDPLGLNDTTFWPNEEQSHRVARSYRPDSSGRYLDEFQISQLTYPLTDREHRFPMPAGGLFSTAQDTATFCRMLLNGGELNGHRFISTESLKELSSRQTPISVKESYGLGFAVTHNGFGHGGAVGTNMEIDTGKGLVFVWMVQHGGYVGDGAKAQSLFKEWASKRFAD